MGGLTLVLGGIRSGKSAFAEQLASAHGRRVLYVATAEGRDDEMRERIRRHQARRPADWRTIAAARDPAAELSRCGGPWDAVLLDSVSGWLGNLLLDACEPGEIIPGILAASIEAAVRDKLESVFLWWRQSDAELIAVSDEVGLSLVSPNAAGRLYQDTLGIANQLIAAVAATVYLVVAGIPMQVKGGGSGSSPAGAVSGNDTDRG